MIEVYFSTVLAWVLVLIFVFFIDPIAGIFGSILLALAFNLNDVKVVPAPHRPPPPEHICIDDVIPKVQIPFALENEKKVE